MQYLTHICVKTRTDRPGGESLRGYVVEILRGRPGYRSTNEAFQLSTVHDETYPRDSDMDALYISTTERFESSPAGGVTLIRSVERTSLERRFNHVSVSSHARFRARPHVRDQRQAIGRPARIAAEP